MPFSDFPEYDRLSRFFKRILKRNAFHPAYLFHGPPGVGKRKMAHAFAMAIFCHNREDDFCGECSACRRMKSGSYPDYHVIEPDGAFIKIDQNRDMIAEATVQPYESAKKIFVLDPADRMRAEAANSLLKILEEPFPFSLFILITASPRAILPTIDSRCQKVRFTPLPYDVLAANLVRQHGLNPEYAATLARLTSGRPRLADDLAQGDFLKERDATIEMLGRIAASREIEAFRPGQQIKERDAAIRFLELLIPVLRDAAALRACGGKEALLNPDRKEEIARATEAFTPEQLLGCWRDAVEGTGNLLMNANVKAQLDRVLLHLCP